MEYISAREAAEKWGITNRMVNYLCLAGRIDGTIKKGTLWLIPQNAKKPVDRRRKSTIDREEEGFQNHLQTACALEDNNKLFFDIFKNFPCPMHICAPDGTMLIANDAYLKFAKIIDPERLYGKHNILINPKLESWGIKDFMTQAFRGEHARAYDVKVPYQDIISRLGSTEDLVSDFMYQDLWSFPIRGRRGELAMVVFIMITTRSYSEKEEIMKGKAYIDDHWKEGLDLDDLAEFVHFSKYYYTRLFKQHTGMTPYQYYKERKINKLKEKLCDKNLSLTQAFAECGLDYNGNFPKLFKKKIGMSPTEYKRLMTEK